VLEMLLWNVFPECRGPGPQACRPRGVDLYAALEPTVHRRGVAKRRRELRDNFRRDVGRRPGPFDVAQHVSSLGDPARARVEHAQSGREMTERGKRLRELTLGAGEIAAA